MAQGITHGAAKTKHMSKHKTQGSLGIIRLTLPSKFMILFG